MAARTSISRSSSRQSRRFIKSVANCAPLLPPIDPSLGSEEEAIMEDYHCVRSAFLEAEISHDSEVAVSEDGVLKRDVVHLRARIFKDLLCLSSTFLHVL